MSTKGTKDLKSMLVVAIAKEAQGVVLRTSMQSSA